MLSLQVYERYHLHQILTSTHLLEQHFCSASSAIGLSLPMTCLPCVRCIRHFYKVIPTRIRRKNLVSFFLALSACLRLPLFLAFCRGSCWSSEVSFELPFHTVLDLHAIAAAAVG